MKSHNKGAVLVKLFPYETVNPSIKISLLSDSDSDSENLGSGQEPPSQFH